MRTEFVKRYVVTQSDGAGGRTFFDARQGRFTFATIVEAQARRDAFLKNPENTPQRFAEVGVRLPLGVGEIDAYPVHFDPASGPREVA